MKWAPPPDKHLPSIFACRRYARSVCVWWSPTCLHALTGCFLFPHPIRGWRSLHSHTPGQASAINLRMPEVCQIGTCVMITHPLARPKGVLFYFPRPSGGGAHSIRLPPATRCDAYGIAWPTNTWISGPTLFTFHFQTLFIFTTLFMIGSKPTHWLTRQLLQQLVAAIRESHLETDSL